ncbi:hypothetical protein PAAG_04746 [Paracoccidioides lutzii Pb01]|uniref:Uncharacterized protein n=1 Tax=Paracoccidioides lutzii (strain ATCC MYA-826 / Pb01) TaxID=502779 RepID=C1H2B7_PARBA|nr:hypothetical protein PAAG_04746 [Paracoccidioides lutzii Pb01]EEH33697.2 hypothetical protein PAAG_04746 [Paracoccidioides lutzii Pb01]
MAFMHPYENEGLRLEIGCTIAEMCVRRLGAVKGSNMGCLNLREMPMHPHSDPASFPQHNFTSENVPFMVSLRHEPPPVRYIQSPSQWKFNGLVGPR